MAVEAGEVYKDRGFVAVQCNDCGKLFPGKQTVWHCGAHGCEGDWCAECAFPKTARELVEQTAIDVRSAVVRAAESIAKIERARGSARFWSRNTSYDREGGCTATERAMFRDGSAMCSSHDRYMWSRDAAGLWTMQLQRTPARARLRAEAVAAARRFDAARRGKAEKNATGGRGNGGDADTGSARVGGGEGAGGEDLERV